MALFLENKKYKSSTLDFRRTKITFIQDVQTKYGNLFNFPEVVDPFIPKSLVGIEDACPICGVKEDLENCVAVRNGRCNHAFHRECIERWFSHKKEESVQIVE